MNTGHYQFLRRTAKDIDNDTKGMTGWEFLSLSHAAQCAVGEAQEQVQAGNGSATLLSVDELWGGGCTWSR